MGSGRSGRASSRSTAARSYDICADGEHRLQVFATNGRRRQARRHPEPAAAHRDALVAAARRDRRAHRPPLGGARPQGFDLVGAQDGHGVVVVDETGGSLTSGRLSARVAPGAPFGITFEAEGRTIVSAGDKSIATPPRAARRTARRRARRQRARGHRPRRAVRVHAAAARRSASANSSTGWASGSDRSSRTARRSTSGTPTAARRRSRRTRTCPSTSPIAATACS